MAEARHVSIPSAAVLAMADRLMGQALQAPTWDTAVHWWGTPERLANYVFALDALNFSFWGDPKWRVSWHGAVLDGYMAMAAALTRAIEEGFDLTDASVMAGCTLADLERVFRGKETVPMLPSRLQNLQEAGRGLLADFGGAFGSLVVSCDRSAIRVVRTVVGTFPSFDDVAVYHGRRIELYKRAQILVADLALAFGGEGLGGFFDLDVLTAFADYKVPQVLREFDVIRYSAWLADRVDRFVELVAGSEEEVEIRAATVVAVWQLGSELRNRGRSVRDANLDGLLWHQGQRMEFMHPYHRTRTRYY